MLEFDIIDEEISEPLGGAHTNYAEVTNNMKLSIMNALDELSKKSSEELRNERYDKFRKMGRFVEA